MRQGIVSGARTHWYDRSIAPINEVYSATVAPHAQVERISYTVPTSKVLQISELTLFAIRRRAATSFNDWGFLVEIFDDVPASMGILTIDSENETKDFIVNVAMYRGLMLPSGYKLTVDTYDTSTGGDVNYAIALSGTLFDA